MDDHSINFLRDSLSHHYSIRGSLDQKSSFLVAISAIIFSVSLSCLNELPFLILGISSFLTVVLSIMVTFLPFKGRKKKWHGLMCWWGFSGKDSKQYEEELRKAFLSDEATAKEYATEIWNLANYSLKPKSKILKVASLVLLSGLVIGFALFLV